MGRGERNSSDREKNTPILGAAKAESCLLRVTPYLTLYSHPREGDFKKATRRRDSMGHGRLHAVP